eukprot:COSAG06_NODE_26695_length_609_cov_0.805882_1_plen_75_part_00
MTDGSNGVGVANDLVALLSAVKHSYIRSAARWSDNQILELALLTACLDCSVARCVELEAYVPLILWKHEVLVTG